MRRKRTATVLSLVAAAILLPRPAEAGIALFANGRTLKVAGYEAIGDMMALRFPGGGRIEIPIQQIERILEDEVVPAIEVVNLPVLLVPKSWRYTETSKPLFRSKYDKTIIEAAQRFDVDAALISAVIKAESDYNPRIVSHKGARGLMQLMPATAIRFGVTDAFDPTQNIHAGAKYLRWLLEKFEGNAELAVAAYNAGEGNVMKYKGIPPFRETVEYVKRIGRHVTMKAVSVSKESVPAPAALIDATSFR